MRDYYKQQRIGIEREKTENRNYHERRKFNQQERKLRMEEQKARDREQREQQRDMERAFRNEMKRQEHETKNNTEYQIHTQNLILKHRHFMQTLDENKERDQFQAELALKLQDQKERFARELKNTDQEIEHIRAQSHIDTITHQAQTDLQTELFSQGFKQLDHQRRTNEIAHNALATAFNTMTEHLTQSKTAKDTHQSELEKLHTQDKIKNQDHKREIKEIETRHRLEMTRVLLEAELRERNYTHQKTTDLCVLLLERALQVRDAEINRETIARWIDEIERETK